MLPLQHAQQLHQSEAVKSAPDFDATAARQCHRQTAVHPALRRRVGSSHLHRQPAVSGYCLALRLPLPIAGQRGQTQPLPAAELNTAQAAGFVFGHQLLGFRATPSAPNFYHRCFLIHLSTKSPIPPFGQMGWSNAYAQTAFWDITPVTSEKLRSNRRAYENALREGCSTPTAGREGSPHKIVAGCEGPRVQECCPTAIAVGAPASTSSTAAYSRSRS